MSFVYTADTKMKNPAEVSIKKEEGEDDDSSNYLSSSGY
jgi:hypothetical protein